MRRKVGKVCSVCCILRASRASRAKTVCRFWHQNFTWKSVTWIFNAYTMSRTYHSKLLSTQWRLTLYGKSVIRLGLEQMNGAWCELQIYRTPWWSLLFWTTNEVLKYEFENKQSEWMYCFQYVQSRGLRDYCIYLDVHIKDETTHHTTMNSNEYGMHCS